VNEVDKEIFEEENPGETYQEEAVNQKENINAEEQPRFSTEFDNFIKESFEYIDPENTSLSERAVSGIEYALKDMRDPRTTEEFIADMNKKIEESPIVRHDNIENFLQHIDEFERDPRILTQFESGTSQGALSSSDRNRWERNIVGSDVDLSLTNREKPVYSEVLIRNSWYSACSERYGEMTFVLNDSVRHRTSFTAGDSSARRESFRSDITQAFMKSDLFSHSTIAKNLIKAESTEYAGEGLYFVEAQTWGGIDISKGDVSAVAIRGYHLRKYKDDSRFQRFIKVLEKNGVRIVNKDEEVPSNVTHR